MVVLLIEEPDLVMGRIGERGSDSLGVLGVGRLVLVTILLATLEPMTFDQIHAGSWLSSAPKDRHVSEPPSEGGDRRETSYHTRLRLDGLLLDLIKI